MKYGTIRFFHLVLLLLSLFFIGWSVTSSMLDGGGSGGVFPIHFYISVSVFSLFIALLFHIYAHRVYAYQGFSLVFHVYAGFFFIFSSFYFAFIPTVALFVFSILVGWGAYLLLKKFLYSPRLKIRSSRRGDGYLALLFTLLFVGSLFLVGFYDGPLVLSSNEGTSGILLKNGDKNVDENKIHKNGGYDIAVAHLVDIPGDRIAGDLQVEATMEPGNILKESLFRQYFAPDQLVSFGEFLPLLYERYGKIEKESLSQNPRFSYILTESDLYPSFRYAYAKGMINAGINPRKLMTCKHLVVLLGLAQGRFDDSSDSSGVVTTGLSSTALIQLYVDEAARQGIACEGLSTVVTGERLP